MECAEHAHRMRAKLFGGPPVRVPLSWRLRQAAKGVAGAVLVLGAAYAALALVTGLANPAEQFALVAEQIKSLLRVMF